MNINSTLKNEGIEIKSKLNNTQVNKIAKIIAQSIYEAFPEHNLNENDIFSSLSSLDMYIADMPAGSAVAKYFYKNSSIYFSSSMNLNNIDTLAIHECIHAIQEIKSPRGKLLKLGLYDLNTNKGQGINEAAVQLMSAIATKTKPDTVKYYNLDFSTDSPLFYPVETALIKQMIYFTGSYPLFHSTIHSNNIFKNTFISKSSEKVYNTIESNFDLIIHYEELLSLCFDDLANLSETKQNLSKIKKLNTKISNIKEAIQKITISTQNLIIENCFNADFELIKDSVSLTEFRQKLYNFKELLINTENYTFYNSYYIQMMNKLEEKSELIKKYGVLTYLNDLQSDLLDLQADTFSMKFFHRLFDKLKLLFEDTIREKN